VRVDECRTAAAAVGVRGNHFSLQLSEIRFELKPLERSLRRLPASQLRWYGQSRKHCASKENMMRITLSALAFAIVGFMAFGNVSPASAKSYAEWQAICQSRGLIGGQVGFCVRREMAAENQREWRKKGSK
jgi:hypothetical protein